MREKLNTLPLSELKELAKAQKLKGFSTLRKAELIDLLCQIAEQQENASEKLPEGLSGQEAAKKSDEAKVVQTAAEDKPDEENQSRKNMEQENAEPPKRFPQNIEEEKPEQQRAERQRTDGQRMEAQQTEMRRETGKENFRNDRNTDRNDGGRMNRNRQDGKGRRVVTRYENQNNYQNRGRGQDNSRNQDYARNQDNRNQDYARNQDNSRSQDYSRNQDNGRSQDYARNQDNGRSQDYTRNQDNGRNQDNRSQDYTRNQDNSRSQDYTRNQDNGRSQDYSRNQDNGRNQDNRSQDYTRNQDNSRSQDNLRNQDSGSGQDNGRNQDGTANSGGRGQDYAHGQDIRPVDINQEEILDLDSGMEANGILEVMPDGFGFIRCENFLPGDNDVYVAPSQIRRFNMKTGDIIRGNRRVKTAAEKFAALLYVTSINGYPAGVAEKRPNFEDLTPIFPDERIHMETSGRSTMAMRVLDLMAPIGKGQRGMIVSPPKAGKTTLLKQVAKAITANQPDMHLIILLIDERPEEVTDIKEAIVGSNVEVIYSTFDELPERHKRVSEMVIERARRLVEHGRDVTILLDSITRLARAYNLVVPPSGRTLSGGLDPAALHMPKRFFGAARNMREGGSLTILATALIDTGSRMDDVIYEEFKGTGNMELVLDRKLSERRIFPAIDILKSGTRRDDLLLSREESEAMEIIRRATNAMKPEESVEKLMDLFAKTRNNQELVAEIRRRRYL